MDGWGRNTVASYDIDVCSGTLMSRTRGECTQTLHLASLTNKI